MPPLVLSLDAPCGEQEADPMTLASGLVDTMQQRPVDGGSSSELAERLGVTESRVSQMRTEALKLMAEGIAAQYEPPVETVTAAGKAAYRRAAYAAALAARSTYATRLTGLPAPRPAVEDLVEAVLAG